MGDFARLLIATLFCAMAAYTQLAWGDDPHFDFPPVDESDMSDLFQEGENGEETFVDASAAGGTLEIPSKPRKPPTPMLFNAATEAFQDWNKAERLPSPTPAPKPAARQIASVVPEQTRRLTQDAMEKEHDFQDSVMEASVGETGATYRKILSVISTGRILTRPIKDNGK